LSPLVVDDPNAERYEALWHSAAEAAYRGDSEALESLEEAVVPLKLAIEIARAAKASR